MLHCHKMCALFVLPKPCSVMKRALSRPAHGIMVFIAFAYSEGSVAPVHLRRLTRVFAHIQYRTRRMFRPRIRLTPLGG